MQDFFHQKYVRNAPVLRHLDPWVTGCLVSFVGLLPRKESPTVTHTQICTPLKVQQCPEYVKQKQICCIYSKNSNTWKISKNKEALFPPLFSCQLVDLSVMWDKSGVEHVYLTVGMDFVSTIETEIRDAWPILLYLTKISFNWQTIWVALDKVRIMNKDHPFPSRNRSAKMTNSPKRVALCFLPANECQHLDNLDINSHFNTKSRGFEAAACLELITQSFCHFNLQSWKISNWKRFGFENMDIVWYCVV